MKKLCRIEDGKKICGVCGGVAAYFEIDPTVVRVVWAIAALFGAGILAYIVCAVIIPSEKDAN